MATYQLQQGFDGVVRTNEDGTQSVIPNADGNTDWQAYQQWLAAGNTPDPAPAPPAVVPQEVTRYQARAVMLQTSTSDGSNLLAKTDAYFNGLPDTDLGKLAWKEAPTVRRDSEHVANAAQALGLSGADVDNLFIAASKIV